MNNAKVIGTLVAIATCLAACSDNTQSSGNGSNAGSSSTQVSKAGGSGTGGATASAGCTIAECFRNIECVQTCTGPVVQSGCCNCPVGTVDSLTCTQGTGGASAASGGAVGKGGATAMGGSATGGALATSSAKAGSTSRGGALTSGGSTSKAGSAGASSGSDCKLLECLRAVECVARCGGPVLQSSCCPCPSGSFDALQCNGTGGTASVGGTTGASGARSAGGRSASGGAAARAGASATGGSAQAGAAALAECRSAADCQVIGNCCGCQALGVGQTSSCATTCTNPTTCGDFSPAPTAQCTAGHCVLDRSCNDTRVTCKRATPVCPAGKLPSVMPDGSCWDGNCIDIVDCTEVPTCDVCTSNGLMCVYANGVRGVSHCVPVNYECQAMSNCSCFGSLCGSITPCNDIPNGISCGGG